MSVTKEDKLLNITKEVKKLSHENQLYLAGFIQGLALTNQKTIRGGR